MKYHCYLCGAEHGPPDRAKYLKESLELFEHSYGPRREILSLRDAGYQTVGDIVNATDKELRKIRWIGPATVAWLRDAVESQWHTWRYPVMDDESLREHGHIFE